MTASTRFAIQPGWRLFFADAGIDAAAVLAQAALPADLLSRPGATLAVAEYFRFWRAIETVADDAALPLRLGRAISVEAFDPAIFASLCSPNLAVALGRIAQFKRLIGPMRLDVESSAAGTSARFACLGSEAPLPRGLVAFEFVFVTQLARLATRQPLRPVVCECLVLPANAAAYTEFLGCELRTGPADVIRFSAQDAARPFLTENLPMWQHFEPALRARLSQLEREAGMGERVRSVLLDLLPSGRSSVDDVAGRLALSRRSLQRHLEDEGILFRDLLAGLRRELAEHYLARSRLALGEIAYLLGFTDANTFQRAFKGWTGRTPGQVRAAAS